MLNTEVAAASQEETMAKTTAKRPAASAKDKSRKPVKSHSAKDKKPTHAPAASADKAQKPAKAAVKPDRLAAHREASGKAAAAIANAAEGGSPSGNGHAASSGTALPTKEGFDIQEMV